VLLTAQVSGSVLAEGDAVACLLAGSLEARWLGKLNATFD
jgi:hypothetical protein